MFPDLDFSRIGFGEPGYLWLLAVPALLLLLWVWRFVERQADKRRLTAHRTLPAREPFSVVGDLPFWLCLVLASACLIIALARPQGPVAMVRQGGIDLMILQDGSASMRVEDVPGNRYQRSMKFLRLLGDALSWKTDRVSLTLFAHVAAPQVRLTKDPNTLFFFFDHLDKEPPFRIDDQTTWDTNLELGIRWGMQMMARDEALHGKSANAKMFLVLSDGELWSGEVQKAIAQSVARNIPIFVVGVGTLGGGKMPTYHDEDGKPVHDPAVPSYSRLDRSSLQAVARAGGGEYFELDRDGDRRIANAIIDAGNRLAPSFAISNTAEPLYWHFISLAGLLVFVGMLFLRGRADIWLQLTGVSLTLAWVWRILG